MFVTIILFSTHTAEKVPQNKYTQFEFEFCTFDSLLSICSYWENRLTIDYVVSTDITASNTMIERVRQYCEIPRLVNQNQSSITIYVARSKPWSMLEEESGQTIRNRGCRWSFYNSGSTAKDVHIKCLKEKSSGICS